MPDFFEFIDMLDANRIRRARELSDLKAKVSSYETDPFGLGSKTVIVFAYAHWEGFYNDCVEAYIAGLKSLDVKATASSWLMLLGNIEGDLLSMINRNSSYEARCDFVDALKNRISAKFESFDPKCLLARSSLDFEKIKLNFRIIDCDITPLQIFRNRLNKELVAWRHSVAHGGSPNLEEFAAERHLELASNLLLALSDIFQMKMLAVQLGR